MLYADIIVNVTYGNFDKTFTYIIPEHLEKVLFIGSPVNIPFGKSIKKGYVIAINETCSIEKSKLKEIIEINTKDISVENNLIELAAWMSRRYATSFIKCLKTVMPVKTKTNNRTKTKYNFEKVDTSLELNKQQLSIYNKVCENINNHIIKNYLLHGITGSGKTLIYIKLMEYIISTNRQGIVLIPEISLTNQTMSRFYSYFGEKVGFIHSRLSSGERYEIFRKVKDKEIDIIIGPRSALFMPFDNLGLIIVDEEHESSYKSEKMPCYNAKDIALYLGNKQQASVIFASATPSISSYYYAVNSNLETNLELIELDVRANNSKLPQVEIVDMRDELLNGNKTVISTRLDELIENALSNNEQIILFLNRRGYYGVVACRSCGHVIKCDHCDVSMSYHNDGLMKCHYCGLTKPKPSICPECGSKHIDTFHVGTQKLETFIKDKYKNARVLRMDADTTKTKQGHTQILEAFKNHEADILIGTQMIVKGHDFENVTVVAAVMADMSLNASDYMSMERTFDLLTQVSGRAGRGNKPGVAVIQTYNPDNYAIIDSVNLDYKDFYKKEIMYRNALGYPPVSHFLKIMIESKNESKLDTAMGYFIKQAQKFENDEVTIIGPASPYISKLKDIYRRVIYIKCESYDILIKISNYLNQYFSINKGFRNMTIHFDFDPMGD